MFRKLKNGVENYLETLSCLDIALLKTCVLAVGMLIGLAVSGRHKKVGIWTACVVFVATYIPLMYKFVPFLKEAFADEYDEYEDFEDYDDMMEMEVEAYE